MDQPKIERLLRLMKMLTGNTSLSIDEIARHLDTSPRSIYRYLDTFKGAGFVVQKHNDIYQLSQESRYFKDISQLIHFTEEEAFIVNKLIDNLDDNNLLKQNLRKKLASVYNCTSLADCIVKGQDANNVHDIIEAIEGHKQVVLKNYASSHNGDIRDRRVEPFAFTTNYVQIWCYDLEQKCNKLFRTSRIEAVEVTDRGWTEGQRHHSDTIDVFRISSNRQHPVKLRQGILAHNLLIEEFPLAERDLTQTGSKQWLLETNVCGYKGIARFVIGLADDIEVVDSPELDSYIQDFVRKNIFK